MLSFSWERLSPFIETRAFRVRIASRTGNRLSVIGISENFEILVGSIA